MAEERLDPSAETDPAVAGSAAYWARVEEAHYREELSRYNAFGETARSLGVQAKMPTEEEELANPSPERSTRGEDANTG